VGQVAVDAGPVGPRSEHPDTARPVRGQGGQTEDPSLVAGVFSGHIDTPAERREDGGGEVITNGRDY